MTLIVDWLAANAIFGLTWVTVALTRQPTLDEKEQPK